MATLKITRHFGFKFVLRGLLATGALGALMSPPTLALDASLYEKTLREMQIAPTVDGIRQYLRELHPDEEQRATVQSLVTNLGSSNYVEREQATKQLLLLPALPVEELAAASQHADIETRWRAAAILEFGRGQFAQTLHAAMMVIRQHELKGLAPELLRAIPLCDKAYLLSTAREALEVTALVDDAELLRDALTSVNVEMRAAAVAALGAALGPAATDDLSARIADSKEADDVKLAAAMAMANYGGRESLQALVDLLASGDVNVRARSGIALQRLTGQRFAYAAYDEPAKRSEAVERWRSWVGREGATAELSFPLKSSDWQTSYLNGNTLLAFGYKNNVIEYDPSGNEVWKFEAKGAWSAEKLPNGNVLIAAYNENRVIEVDPSGNVIWDYNCANPLNARPLPNGHYLISVYGGKKVVEVDSIKRLIWEYDTSANCADAVRLENGNTLVASGNNVVEVTPDKKSAWEFQCNQVYGIQSLGNGNMLICELGGRVIEITRDKKIVWEFAEPNAVDAFRTANGNTLITSGRRFVEVTPDKKIVWEKDGCNYGTARR